ncbi:hypothetical protein [Caloranaerobacter sp. DY30410]
MLKKTKYLHEVDIDNDLILFNTITFDYFVLRGYDKQYWIAQ